MQSYDLGAAPCEVKPIQVGVDNYEVKARRECTIYLRQLERMFPNPPQGCKFTIRGNQHEFGTYYTVNLRYNPDIEEHLKFMLKVDSELPGEWDQTALEELARLESKE